MKKQKKQESLTVFFSYAQADQVVRDQLATHLSQLKREGLIEAWSDQQILPGSDRAQAIDQAIRSASLILLLISADFLASDTQYQVEMQQALERHKRGEARVLPLIVRPCDWQSSPFAHLQCLPRGGKPITTWSNRDEVFLAIVQEIRQLLAQPQFTHSLRSDTQRQNRIRLLKRVRSVWIKGLLEHSLYKAAWIDLHLQEQPDALENPWRFQLQELNQPPHVHSLGTSIVEVYDEADGELLILGEPGSGKTTLLLQLARTLLDRAEADEHQQIPVVFNLSSWAQRQPALATWLVEELKIKYQVPQKIGKLWVETDQLLPLLDGFDEVAEKHRAECVRAINAYRQIHGLVPLVVCSRTTEYLIQAKKVSMQKAVLIQPLTAQQVNAYLESAGGQLEGLRAVLRNERLQELANTPLMLSILVLTYHGKSVEDIPKSDSVEVQMHQVFEAYIQRMFQHRSVETRYTPEQTKYWLIWLAKQMRQKGQSEFYIERLQLDWLSANRRKCELYTSLAFGPPSFLVATSVYGIELRNFWNGLLVGLLNAVLGILFVWFIERDIYLFRRRKKGKPIFARERKKSNRRLRLTALFTQILGERADFAFLSGLLTGMLVWVLAGPDYGLINGVFFGMFLVVLGKFEKYIQPAEMLVWSWKSVWRNALKSLTQGLTFGFFFGFFDAYPYLAQPRVFLTTLSFGLSVGFSMGLVMMLMRGFSSNMLDMQQTIKPNQGIKNSLSNSTRLGLVSGLALGLVIFFLYSIIIHRILVVGYVDQIPWSSSLVYGVSDGLAVAYLYWLINGGFACVQHFVLRVVLWQTKCTPWNYPRFLDHASDRILLRKTGGGYIFLHRLLLEHFATLGESASPETYMPVSKAQKEG